MVHVALLLAAAIGLRAQDTRLSNVSVRTTAGGTEALITGFTIWPGPDKTMRVRAVGPTLGTFAFGAKSQDAAVQTSLAVNSGGYSVRIAPAETVTGSATLAEIHGDADLSVRIVNFSTSGFVGTDENVFTPSFVLHGTLPKRVRILAVAPGPASSATSEFLADPQFTALASGASVASATNYDEGGIGELKLAAAAAGTLAIAEPNRDAAVVVTLPPEAARS